MAMPALTGPGERRNMNTLAHKIVVGTRHQVRKIAIFTSSLRRLGISNMTAPAVS